MSYATDDVQLLREIVDTGEARLQAQLTTALASDQRNLVLAGFLSATIVALVGGAIALFLQTPPLVFLGWDALFVAAGLAIGLFLLVWAARPVDWHYPGTRPRDWISDVATKREMHEVLADRAADIERKAGLNAAILSSHAKLLNAGLLVAALSITIGGIGLGAYFLCWRS